MALFYLDLENGNDANDGLSFATRWKTFANGPTAARVNPGDVIRVMASPPPVRTALQATWTQDSAQVTTDLLACVDLCNCDTAWTPAANVTAVADTSASYVKEGTASAKLTVNAAFTTGKAAYFTLPAPLNLSSSRFVTLWIRTDTPIAANALSLRLCSDTAGNTSQNSLPLNILSLQGGNHGLYPNHWLPLTIDYGAALYYSVRSIALYVEADLSTSAAVTIWLDNLLANNILTASNPLGLNSLIGLPNSTGNGGSDTETWYPIKCISGTTITLDQRADGGGNVTKYPNPAQANVPLSYRNALVPNCWATSGNYLVQTNKSGAAGNPITVSFGWSRSDMATQGDETWVDGVNSLPYGLYAGSSWNAFERFGCVRCYTGISLSTNDLTLQRAHALSAGQYGIYVSSAQGAAENLWSLGHGGTGIHVANTPVKLAFNLVTACSGSGLAVGAGEVRGGLIANGYGTALAFSGAALISDVTTRGNAYSFSASGVGPNSPGVLVRCVTQEASETSGLASGYNYRVHSRNHDSVPGYHIIWTDGGKIETDATTTHTGSGKSWKASVTSTSRTAAYPLDLRLATLAVKAQQPVTVTAWVRRSSPNLAVGLVAEAEAVPFTAGAASVAAWAGGAANTWEQVSLTFTATEDGPVCLYLQCYGGSTYAAWVDDLAISGGLATASEVSSLDWDAFAAPLGPSGLGGSSIIVIDD